ncbi:Coenzyme F420:L-glutamate ligase [Aquimixticola soesokkakensis]|uniref:Coenzyme F420:L-glutamate ligase n=1 Tax=Aquimixticola soesokkakensis TaxID=1519096 RepID=A0A1Y5RU02_9RHOB|nr:coenzyme F420-0:L-glutamate ligase [Aquimixticola soesokkakensis]SLN25241.1 Coenzyme F420:L-glutamate ligase [Aquimixticola soesokkakensis]
MSLTLTALKDVPLVREGDDLCALVLAGLETNRLALAEGDTLVLAQKIVSKSEGRFRRLSDITPTPQAIALATETDKDPRLVQAILDESTEVVRKRRGVLVVRHRLGLTMAQAGIDQSNVEGADDRLLLLPRDPDASATRLRESILAQTGKAVGIVIADSFGRPFRNGTTGIAIGAAGIQSFIDRRGDTDLFGRVLKVSTIAHADEIAAAASLLMGQADEGLPIVHLRGPVLRGDSPAADLIRPAAEDLFL